MKITKQRLQQIIQEEINSHKASQLNENIDAFEEGEAGLNEDGHTDIPSAARKMKLAIEDAGQILAALEGGQGDLPAWWMSKVTMAADYLNKARDYLLVPSDDVSEQ